MSLSNYRFLPVFVALGSARFFQLSIFDPAKKDLTIQDHFKEELKYINIKVPSVLHLPNGFNFVCGLFFIIV